MLFVQLLFLFRLIGIVGQVFASSALQRIFITSRFGFFAVVWSSLLASGSTLGDDACCCSHSLSLVSARTAADFDAFALPFDDSFADGDE